MVLEQEERGGGVKWARTLPVPTALRIGYRTASYNQAERL